MTKGADEVARLFGETSVQPGNAAAELYPGCPSLVFAAGELRSMVWGFPLVLKSKKTGLPLKPTPVNNTRADKLGSFMWRYSLQERRCLIPVSEFAEAEGEKGAMTHPWFGLTDQPTYAIAGIWRDTPECGPSYSMVMTQACIHIDGVHDRMPVILRPDDWRQWTDAPTHGAMALCVPYAGEMMVRRGRLSVANLGEAAELCEELLQAVGGVRLHRISMVRQ